MKFSRSESEEINDYLDAARWNEEKQFLDRYTKPSADGWLRLFPKIEHPHCVFRLVQSVGNGRLANWLFVHRAPNVTASRKVCRPRSRYDEPARPVRRDQSLSLRAV